MMKKIFNLYLIQNQGAFQKKLFTKNEADHTTMFVDEHLQYCLVEEKDCQNRLFQQVETDSELVSYFPSYVAEQVEIIFSLLQSDFYKIKRIKFKNNEEDKEFKYIIKWYQQKTLTKEQVKKRLTNIIRFSPIAYITFVTNHLYFEICPNTFSLKVYAHSHQKECSEKEILQHVEEIYKMLIHGWRKEQRDITFSLFEMQGEEKQKQDMQRASDVLSYLFSSVDEAELKQQLQISQEEYTYIQNQLTQHTLTY